MNLKRKYSKTTHQNKSPIDIFTRIHDNLRQLVWGGEPL